MKIAMSSGHGSAIQGASGSPCPPEHNEVAQARKIVDRTAELLRSVGVECVTFHDDVSDSQSENLDRIVSWHNQQTRDRDISIHLNAYDGSAHGVEMLYCSSSGEAFAIPMSAAVAQAGGLFNRGAKYRGDLAFLNGTSKPAVLAEMHFCDNTSDCQKHDAAFEEICIALASSMSGVDIGDTPPPEPIEPPEPAPPEGSRVDILGRVEGDVAVYINGSLITGNKRCENAVHMRIGLTGEVVLCINGQEFHNRTEPLPPPETGIAENHKDVEATVFGGWEDQENSAYPPFDYLNDTDLYVALPYSWPNDLFPDNAPRVRVYCGELSAEAPIRDKGPWLIDDRAYVIDATARPLAETCYEEGTPLPRGPNAGKVPSNAAGIDLSPALAQMIGVSGKGLVSWTFVEQP
jgi:hypothetical protein